MKYLNQSGFAVPASEFIGSDQMSGDSAWDSFLNTVSDVGSNIATSAQQSVTNEASKYVDNTVQKLLGTGEKAVTNSDGTITIIKETQVPNQVVQSAPMSTNMKIGLAVGGVLLVGMFGLLAVKVLKS